MADFAFLTEAETLLPRVSRGQKKDRNSKLLCLLFPEESRQNGLHKPSFFQKGNIYADYALPRIFYGDFLIYPFPNMPLFNKQ